MVCVCLFIEHNEVTNIRRDVGRLHKSKATNLWAIRGSIPGPAATKTKSLIGWTTFGKATLLPTTEASDSVLRLATLPVLEESFELILLGVVQTNKNLSGE